MTFNFEQLQGLARATGEPAHRSELPAMTAQQEAAFTAQMQVENRMVPFPNQQRIQTEAGPVLEAHAARRTGPDSAVLGTMHRPLDPAGQFSSPPQFSGPAQPYASGSFVRGDLSPHAQALVLPTQGGGAQTHGLTPPERAAGEVQRPRLDEVNRALAQHARQEAPPPEPGGAGTGGIPPSRRNSVDGLVDDTLAGAQKSKIKKTSDRAVKRFDNGLGALNAKQGRSRIDPEAAQTLYREQATQKKPRPAEALAAHRDSSAALAQHRTGRPDATATDYQRLQRTAAAKKVTGDPDATAADYTRLQRTALAQKVTGRDDATPADYQQHRLLERRQDPGAPGPSGPGAYSPSVPPPEAGSAHGTGSPASDDLYGATPPATGRSPAELGAGSLGASVLAKAAEFVSGQVGLKAMPTLTKAPAWPRCRLDRGAGLIPRPSQQSPTRAVVAR